jgi:starch synthase
VTLRVLFAASEVAPLSKTGGLAYVAHDLPKALHRIGLDVKVMTPAYRGMLDAFSALRPVVAIELNGFLLSVWEGSPEPGAPPLWLVDCPELYARVGALYTNALGLEYPDNAQRFGLFSALIARLALGQAGSDWRPDVVHLNDWHTGLAAPWIGEAESRPGTVFTIHNLAYQGNYPPAQAQALGLPAEWMTPAGLEFHGQLSFLKAGLVYSDAITTVSPTYAREIQTPEHGGGLHGVLAARAAALTGILNGIDEETWSPVTDRHVVQRYGQGDVAEGKRANRRALQRRLGLAEDDESLLVVYIGRLVHQKGVDLLLERAAAADRDGMQLALLGEGDRALEAALLDFAAGRPGRVAISLSFDDALAHLMEAGADALLMPSRFEPCGLNQMYSQRYGTIPVVRRTGGLADTVVDATPEALADGTATGVCFEHPDAGAIGWAIGRAMELRRAPGVWHALQQNGMRRDFGWSQPATRYAGLYQSVQRRRKSGSVPGL